MSNSVSINEPAYGSEISITAIVAHSYNFLTAHFMLFLKLSAGPILIWSSFELFFDYLYFEHGTKYESGLPRIFSTAAFVLIWYRYYLLGEGQATYKKLYGHMRRTSVFSIRMFLLSVARMAITIVAIVIPTLGISLYMVYSHQAGGGALTDQVIASFVYQSIFFVGLVLSPIFVRLSFFSAAVALGRSQTTFRHVWKKTAGYTWVLWHLTLRAFLPFALYNYLVMGQIREAIAQYDLHYFWASLLTNIPTIFIIYIMLAIVIVANSEAFKILFGIRDGERA